jgi:hypothetical protein
MDMIKTEELLRAFNKSERHNFYISPVGVTVFAQRTDKICPGDFAVGLGIPGRADFYPTHVRLFVDLYIKNQSNPQATHRLFCALEQAYNGDDSDQLVKPLSNLVFPMQLDEASVNLYYAQLLMLEQDFNYGPHGCKLSKYNPPRAYFMGFIRNIASGMEIDKLISNLNYGFTNKIARAVAERQIDCADLTEPEATN